MGGMVLRRLRASALATPTVVNITNSSTATGTTLDVAMPASTTAGNRLIMILGYWNTAPADPAGWTLKQKTTTGNMNMAVYEKLASGSDGTTVTVTGFASGDPRTGSVVQCSGSGEVHLANVFASSAATREIPSITTTAPGCLILRAFFTQDQTGNQTLTWSGTGTEIADFTSPGGGGWYAHQGVHSELQTAAGPTGAVTVTPSGSTSSNWAGAAIAILPGVAPGPVTPVDVIVTGTNVGARNTLTNNVIVPYPTNSKSGDLIVIAVLSYRNSGAAYTHTTPAGWDIVQSRDTIATSGKRWTTYAKVRGAETSVTINASVTLFWLAQSFAFENFYTAQPIEAGGSIIDLVPTSPATINSISTDPLPLGAPAGVLYLGGGDLVANTTLTSAWDRGTELRESSVSAEVQSGTFVTFSMVSAFEQVNSAGVVGANTIRHPEQRPNSWAGVLAIRPASWVEPPPTLASMTPSTGSTNGGTVVTLSGTGFKGTGATTETVVKVDGTALASSAINVTSETSMTITMPAHAAGSANITVTTSKGTSNAVTFTYAVITLTAQGMQKSGTQSLGSSGSITMLTNMSAQSGTNSANVISNQLKVNGDGNITVTGAVGYSTSTGSLAARIYKNGVQVATGTATSVTWTGDVVEGDLLDLRVYKTTALTRTVNSGSLAYTVNAAPVLFASYDFPEGTGPLDTTYWTQTGPGVHTVTNNELNGDATPSMPQTFSWWNLPVPGTGKYKVQARIRWNGRSPEHSACGICVAADPGNDVSGIPGSGNGVQFSFTATIESLYYEKTNQTPAFVSLTGVSYNTTAKYPEDALLEVEVDGTNYIARVNGTIKQQGSTTAIPTSRRRVGLVIQNDELEAGGGGPPGRLAGFRVWQL